MSSWGNVQVYWSQVKKPACDWSVANKEEKRGLPSSSLLLNTKHSHNQTHHNFWSSAALTVFDMYKQY